MKVGKGREEKRKNRRKKKKRKKNNKKKRKEKKDLKGVPLVEEEKKPRTLQENGLLGLFLKTTKEGLEVSWGPSCSTSP